MEESLIDNETIKPVSIRFIDTKRFSPVVHGGDLPWEEDMFHVGPSGFKSEMLNDEAYIVDEEWWAIQYDRCINGYTVENAIEEGGDSFITTRQFYKHEKSGEVYSWGQTLDVVGNDEYFLNELGITIKNRSVTITGRHYFYLNFWHIKRVPENGRGKQHLPPRFTDLSFENWWIREKSTELSKDILWAKARQKGMEQPHSEILLTNNGWKPMGEIQVGDMVATRKNKFSKVEKLFPQGAKDVYEVTLMDGRKVRCGYDHLWKVWDKKYMHHKKNVDRHRILSTKELLQIGIKTGKLFRFALPDIEPLSFEEKELSIHPYLLGLLLGDGTINNSLKISTGDDEILESIQNILGDKYYLHPDTTSDFNYGISYYDVHEKESHEKYGINRQLKLNPLKEEFKRLGLQKKCEHKFIPEIYKHASIDQRLELIRGLMDSDGHISPDGCMEFKNVSKLLIDGLAYILRSLGIRCKVSSFDGGENKDYHRLYISTTKFNLFRLERKAKLFNPNKDIFTRNPIVSIVKLDYQEESSCIIIDDDEHVYLTRDFIPTHNSEEEACDSGYDFLFNRDSQTVIIGGEDFYNENTMKMVVKGLEKLQHTQFYKDLKKGGASKDFYATKKTGAELYSRTCKDNSEAASGLSPSKAHLEEIGIYKKGLLVQVTDTLDASLEAEGLTEATKTGRRIYTGTGGDMENGVADMEKLLYNPRKYNLMEFKNVYEDTDGVSTIARFIPASKFKVVDIHGNSLIKESIKYILDKIENADAESKHKLTVMNPLKPSAIFASIHGGYFGPTVTQWCNERKAHIKNHRDSRVVKRYRGAWINPKNYFEGVEFTPDELGPFMIGELPEVDKDGAVYENLYRAGTDSYDQHEAAYSTSLGACWIKKGFLNANRTYNKFVAGILERPSEKVGGSDLFYEHTAMMCVAYNAINLIEYSKILILDWYVKHNLSSLLKLRPEFVTASMVIASKTNNRWGIDPSTKSEWLKMHRKWLSDKRNIENCDFIELLEAWSNFRYDPSGKKYNCDVTIATSLCTVCEEDDAIMDEELSSGTKEERKKNNRPTGYTMDSNGNLIMM